MSEGIISLSCFFGFDGHVFGVKYILIGEELMRADRSRLRVVCNLWNVRGGSAVDPAYREQLQQPARDHFDAAARAICAGVGRGMGSCVQHPLCYWSVYGGAVPLP